MEWKFRGFDATGQKGWVYGDLTHTKRILQEEPWVEDRMMVGGYEVVPCSIGLCTGIKDSNGTDIYEGDIISVYYNGKKVFDAPIVWSDEFASFIMDEGEGCYSPISAAKISDIRVEIIGKVYKF